MKYQSCNIGLGEYLNKYSSLECPDPQKLFDMVSVPPERIIRGYEAWSSNWGSLGFPSFDLKKIHGVQDCILVEIPDFMEFLDELQLAFHEDVIVEFFQKGRYSETKTNSVKFTVRENEEVKVHLNYDILSRPSTSADPCTKDLEYDKDDCLLHQIHEVR